MKRLTRRARWLYFVLAGFWLSLLLNGSPLLERSATAQLRSPRPAEQPQLLAQAAGRFDGTAVNSVTLTVENTAFAVFTPPATPPATPPTPPTPPTAPPVTVTSNPTVVPVQRQETGLEIIKTGDRAAAEPGDVVVYRLLVRNTGTVAIAGVFVDDVLPIGFQYVDDSAEAVTILNSVRTPIAIADPARSGRTVQFQTGQTLQPGQEITITYAALLTPDSIRGSGRNSATAFGLVGDRRVASNVASHQVVARPGILSDCGTIVGRVFVDKNFDGQQQPGEPGVPNAVIFMDDGNRILTDPDGLFSLANVISGNRSGTLDLTSLPGYTLAPNLYWIEGNSPARLVRLQPGGLARMNFAVTPTYGEGQQ